MENKIIVAMATGAFAACMCCGITDAARLDGYRDMVAKQMFTIKYENCTLPSRKHNREGDVYGGRVTSGDYAGWSEMRRIMTKGLLVVDGKNRYTQKMLGEMYAAKRPKTFEWQMCMLNKNGEFFSWYQQDYKDGKPDFFGKGFKNQVEAGVNCTADSLHEALTQEMDYGDPAVAKMLAVIFPPNPSDTLLNVPEYSFVDSGTLANGQFYEDYSASEGGRFYAARFYFDGNKLVKFTSATFPESLVNAQNEMERSVIRIDEFLPVPESQYLSLPKGLKDVTERGQKENKER